jgi:L-lactate utilization protein LutC
MEINERKSGSARAEVLASIRANLEKSAPFDADHREHHSSAEPISVVTTKIIDKTVRIENFRENLEAVGGRYTLVESEEEAASVLKSLVETTGAGKIGISDSELVKRLVALAGIETVENAPAEFLFDSDLGITAAQWGIAETGTLVLESRRESHRLTSLVPPVHLCILKAGDIRQTLGEILELTSRDLSRAVTFITGASRTSDIELTLAIGVHGPGELHVIVIAD